MYNKYNLSNDAMGIQAGLTEVFSITPKLFINSPLRAVLENGDIVNQSVDKWIKNNPLHLLYLLKNGVIQLCKDAHSKLFNTLKVLHPLVYEEYQKDKLRKVAYKKALAYKRSVEQMKGSGK